MTPEPTPSASGPEPDVAAAELALGVLDGAERGAALRRMIAEPGFAREVERWRDHFDMLFAGFAEQAAPASLFERIESRIAGRADSRRAANPWKPAALAASVAALLMTGVALRLVEAPPAPQAATAPMIAAMAAADKLNPQPALYDVDAGVVKMPGPMEIPAGRSAQLWAIEGDKPAIPLGTFRAAGRGMYVAEAKMKAVIKPGTMLAISIEPMGGSPTGRPTGPVIASGMLTRV